MPDEIATLATVAQVKVRMPPDAEEPDNDYLEALLDDASGLARTLVDDEAKWPNEGDAPASVVAVVCRSVVRAADNPRGMGSLSQGNWSQGLGSRQVGGSENGTGVFFTDDERRKLRRAAGKTGWSSVEVTHHYGHDVPQHLLEERAWV